MQSVRSRRPRQVILVAILLAAALWPAPAGALDLFARYRVSVQFATADGQPMAEAEVRVFAPGQPGRPALTGRTDSAGKFEFAADEEGLWTAEARSGSEIARATVKVGDGAQKTEPLSPWWVLGVLFLLLVLAVGFRIAQARARRR